MTEYNGRINIMGESNTPYESEYDNTDYTEALAGEKVTTVLSRAYFSKENIDIIQNGIKAGVYRKSDGTYIIGKQDVTNIKIIMRRVYLEHVQNVPNQITEEIRYLNSIVLDECVHNVYSSVISHMKYKRDVSTLPIPIDRPQMDPHKDHRQMELTPKWVVE